jgi:hypothetical protein
VVWVPRIGPGPASIARSPRASAALAVVKRLRNFLRRPRAERWPLLRLLVLLPACKLMLRVLGYVRLRRLLERGSQRPVPRLATAEELLESDRLAGLVALAGRRGLVRVTCLPQALLLHALLRRRSLMPELQLGVRKPNDAVEAHAWVELQGRELGVGALGHQAFNAPRTNRA